MPPLPRLLRRHIALPQARRHTPFHPWPPAADAFLSRGLTSSSAAAAAAAAGREKSSRRTLGYLLGVAAATVGCNVVVKVKPGESALAFYTAENRSSAPITGVSTYNVAPMKE
ncbi:hypothetical protein QYE76_062335 [Lolium multiflorum]|uniref:Uncharacterized protein n=1 Tax=Lolium multiflorum TaxID=4521 RepID=A0AAD8S3K1_LOLMU|nr:hypothetical protein QYE76_062335 [Lolium multiflorum]